MMVQRGRNLPATLEWSGTTTILWTPGRREQSTRSLAELLCGCSYDSLIIPKFVELCGDVLPVEANAAVVLYDFRHYEMPGRKPSWNSDIKLRYMGSTSVPTPWPTSSEW